MARVPLWAAGIAALALTQACASAPAQPAGYVEFGDSYALAMDPRWTEFSYEAPLGHRSVRAFTWDGPRLNQLYVAGDLPEGAALVSAQGSRRAPGYRPSASRGLQAAFVGGTLAVMGYTDIDIEPAKEAVFARYPGVRFDFVARAPAGLAVEGVMVMAESGQGLNAALFVAARGVYADAHKGELEQLLASATRDF